MKPAIVLVAYNRINSFKRLLKSIENANYSFKDIPLIISIDGGAETNNEILKIANDFNWEYGEKKILNHQEKLGLRKHIIFCGDLSYEYGSVIIIEDDIFVSKQFYSYCQSASDFYDIDSNIAGIALYSYHWNVHANFPFIPLKSEFDTYFMQFPASWGQCWTNKQWDRFKIWYNKGQVFQTNDKIPENVKNWPKTSWLKYYTKYMVDMNKYFVFTYYGYSTNFSDRGTHNAINSVLYQVPLSNDSLPLLQNYSKHCVRYDVFFELHSDFIKSNVKSLQSYDFEMDLYGIKLLNNIENSYMISTKKCINPIRRFSFKLRPQEQNILNEIEESPLIINFGLVSSFTNERQIFFQQDYFSTVKGIKNTTKYLINLVRNKLYK